MSKIKDFYKGKTIFVTGATGFVGKKLVEKILYSCRDVNKIYILIRDKKHLKATERANNYVLSSAFNRIKYENPEILEKITPITGDITGENLNLSPDDLNNIRNDVSIVFHSAASISFNQDLPTAFNINTLGTQRVIDLCHQIKKLQVLVHVSTAYTNTENEDVEERIYSSTVDVEEVRKIVEQYPGSKHKLKEIIGEKPNTYAFTKALAENFIMKNRGDLPVAIVRPSIVIGSLSEPVPGRIEGWNAVNVLFGLLGLGFTKVQLGNADCTLDMVPVDLVANLMIAASYECAQSKVLRVYNCCTGNSNPMKVGKLISKSVEISRKHSFHMLPFSFCLNVESRIFYLTLNFIFHVLLALICDIREYFLPSSTPAIFGSLSKTRLILAVTTKAVHFFLVNQWNFHDKNVSDLWQRITEDEKRIFNFDMKSIEWNTCLENYILGIRKYAMYLENKKKK